MPFHPNPMSMAVHVEHHRQELLDQARRERQAKEALAGASHARRDWREVSATIASGVQTIAARWRPGLAQPMDLPRSTPGEAT